MTSFKFSKEWEYSKSWVYLCQSGYACQAFANKTLPLHQADLAITALLNLIIKGGSSRRKEQYLTNCLAQIHFFIHLIETTTIK